MNTKHPVSVLQELMARQRKNLPNYQILDLSTPGMPKFRCIIAVDDIQVEGNCSSKQTAKREAAAKALRVLGYYEDNCGLQKLGKHEEAYSIGYNAVGALNEYVAQHKLPYPKYDELGVNAYGEFIISCHLIDYKREGYASTKKQAKQLASHEILQLLKRTENITGLKKMIKDEPETSDEEILAKFKALSTLNSCPISKTEVKTEPREVPDEPSSSVEKSASKPSLCEILQKLQEFQVAYTINVMKRNPFVLILKFDDKNKTTIAEIDESYEEANYKVLEKALTIMTALQETA